MNKQTEWKGGDSIPRYSQDEPFENREHIIWEIGYCGKAASYAVIIGAIFVVLGVVADLLDMKLVLGSTSWLLLAIIAVVLSLAPHLHMIMAKQLLGMELIKKDMNTQASIRLLHKRMHSNG